MNAEYSNYLNSNAWKAKRQQRLAISGYRCAACTNDRAIHVHHLTYARIFNEDMADLMPLCERHHQIAEQLIRSGKLSRTGEVLFLTTETLRLVVPGKLEKKRKARLGRRKSPKRFQYELLSDDQFSDLLVHTLPHWRGIFKRAVKSMFRGPDRLRWLANAFTIYDQMAPQCR